MDAFTHIEPIDVDEDTLPEVTAEEVALHNTAEDLWIIIYKRVYDVTEWQHTHPGGDDILQQYGGKDASSYYRSVQHSPDANKIRPNFMIARLKESAPPPPPPPPPRVRPSPPKPSTSTMKNSQAPTGSAGASRNTAPESTKGGKSSAPARGPVRGPGKGPSKSAEATIAKKRYVGPQRSKL